MDDMDSRIGKLKLDRGDAGVDGNGGGGANNGSSVDSISDDRASVQAASATTMTNQASADNNHEIGQLELERVSKASRPCILNVCFRAICVVLRAMSKYEPHV